MQKRIREMFVVDIFPTIANLLFGELLSVDLKHDSTFYRLKRKRKKEQ